MREITMIVFAVATIGCAASQRLESVAVYQEDAPLQQSLESAPTPTAEVQTATTRDDGDPMEVFVIVNVSGNTPRVVMLDGDCTGPLSCGGTRLEGAMHGNEWRFPIRHAMFDGVRVYTHDRTMEDSPLGFAGYVRGEVGYLIPEHPRATVALIESEPLAFGCSEGTCGAIVRLAVHRVVGCDGPNCEELLQKFPPTVGLDGRDLDPL